MIKNQVITKKNYHFTCFLLKKFSIIVGVEVDILWN